MVFANLKAGFHLMWINKRIVVIFYLVNLLFGLMLILPLRNMLAGFVGDSLVARELAAGFDLNYLLEFLANTPAAGTVTPGLLGIAFAAHALAGLFLSGGVIAGFVQGVPYSAKFFWGNSAAFFGRYFRLLLLSLPVLLLLLLIPMGITAGQRLIFGSDPYQYVNYWGNWLRLGLRFLGVVVYYLILDYARIITVERNERRMRTALGEGIRFVLGNFRRTFTLIFAFWAVGFLGFFFYNPLANWLDAPTAGLTLLLVIAQQGFLFFRMMLKIATWGGEITLYKILTYSE